MLINCTNHPYARWNTLQRKAAAQYGLVLDMPFPKIEPQYSSDDLRRIVKTYADSIEDRHPDAVLVTGEFSFTFMLVDKLLTDGLKVLCTRSKRLARESINPDGSSEKRTVFRNMNTMGSAYEKRIIG